MENWDERVSDWQVQRQREAVVRLYAKLGSLAEAWLESASAGLTHGRSRVLRARYEEAVDAALEVGLVFGYGLPESGELADGGYEALDAWALWERLLGSDWPHTAAGYAQGMRDLVVLGRVLGVHEAAA
ncbi:MAG: hypothetical protein IRZ33_06075 [Alicyclobacillaceae bacterium]|nr:hypothetical protein [Alicyclobacillaceae bacterium]